MPDRPTFTPSLATPLDAAAFRRRAHDHLAFLYGPRADEVLRRLTTLLAHQAPPLPSASSRSARAWRWRGSGSGGCPGAEGTGAGSAAAPRGAPSRSAITTELWGGARPCARPTPKSPGGPLATAPKSTRNASPLS